MPPIIRLFFLDCPFFWSGQVSIYISVLNHIYDSRHYNYQFWFTSPKILPLRYEVINMKSIEMRLVKGHRYSKGG